ncbi:MAG: hypothetical protein J7L45_00295 [Candidatus Aenigmarchaeota archaeon]|nr:hypothetical protein [Candidatus Aenigmarchaeota archaeon]
MWYEKIKEAAKNFTVFLAYNANIDAIVDVKEIERLFSYQDYLEADGREPVTIDTREDLLAAILNSMRTGIGSELRISKEVGEWLKRNVTIKERRMGGQIGIMANMLARLGFNCLVYFPLLSREQSELFVKRPNLKFLTPDGWKESGYYLEDAITKINWIFEFEKGEKIFDVVARDSSRFIAASRPDEDRIKSQLLESHIDEINEISDVAILSGYHDVKREYSDSDYMEQIIAGEKVLKRISVPKQLEFASISDVKIREAIVEHIARNVDVVDMDSSELRLILEVLGEPITEEGIIGEYKAMKTILERLNLKCVKMHKKHYFISVSKNYVGKESIEKGYEVARGLCFARSMDLEETWENMRLSDNVEPSPIGIEEKKKLEEFIKNGNEFTVVVVPNKVNPDPKITVGLGDVVSGSSFVIENLLERMK